MAVNVATLLTSLLPALNAAALTDAELSFWTTAELYEFADEAAKWLARNAGVFVAVDSSFQAERSVDLTDFHISTIFAAVDGAALREANVRELEALDATWESTQGLPKRYTMTGARTLKIYPDPMSEGALELIEHRLPADITSLNATLAAPAAIAGFLAIAILGAARSKEGDASMPEIAAHCTERTNLYAGVLTALYGGDQ